MSEQDEPAEEVAEDVEQSDDVEPPENDEDAGSEGDHSARGVLSDEELEALRGATGEGDDGAAGATDENGCAIYDFRDPSRTLNGRLPGLDTVHEAFCIGMHQVFRQLLGRSVDVTSGETTLSKLGDYQKSLSQPSSVHAAPVQERKHAMFLCADGRFVYSCVDAFFGGANAAAPSEFDRDFSTSEKRFTQMLMTEAFRELQNAWAPICTLRFGEVTALKSGGLGNGRDDQIMVVSRFQVGLNPGHGEFHVVMPYALLDTLRHFLTAGPRDASASHNWRTRFAQNLTHSEMQAQCLFSGVRITFAELLRLRPGDFIPVSASNRVLLTVADHPLYVAEPVSANGMAAAKIVARFQPR